MPKTPEKLISPPARRTRSARKKRNSEAPHVNIQENDVSSTPQLAETVETPTPKVTRSARKKPVETPTPKATRSAKKKSEPVETLTPKAPLPPVMNTALPPLPPSTRKRSQLQKKIDDTEEQPKSNLESSTTKRKKTVRVTEPKKTVAVAPEEETAETKHQMAVQVHRFRNANYIPKGILRLCSTPYLPESNHYPQLAVSREGGSVELVSVNEKWKCVGIVEGMKNRNVDAMAWVCGTAKSDGEPQPMITDDEGQKPSTGAYFCKEHELAAEAQMKRRLFGASRDGTIFEIDFKTKRHSGVIGSGGGAVFCLASLCPCCTGTGGNGNCGKLVAAGCEDGSVRVYKAADMSDNVSGNPPCLELVSTLPSVGGAVISIAWLPGSGASGMDGSVIYAGAADGTIRKFECVSALQMARLTGYAPHAISTGAVLNNDDVEMAGDSQLSSLQWKAGLRITVENRGRRSATKIWALQALRDGTVVSGDSMGNVQFWDGNAGTLLQSFEHNPNNGDVLDLAVSFDQNKVMASGVDSKVVCIERIPSSSCSESKWVLTNQQRSHTHDVNSLAMIYMTDPVGNLGSSKKKADYCRELLCSGGVDTKVCSYFVANMKKYRAKIAYKYPTKAPITISRVPRILSIMRSAKIEFYQLAAKLSSPVDANMSNVSLNEEQAYLGSVGISSNYNLVSFDVSEDGKFLAVSHTAGLLLFALDFVDSVNEEDGASSKVVVPKKLSLPSDADAPCSALKFGSDFLICATTSGPINVLRFQNESETTSATLDHTFDLSATETYACETFPIVQLTLSADGRWFAAARNTMGKGSLQVFSMSKHQHWWTLPCTEAPQSCVKFLGAGGDVDPALAVACNNGVVYLFDVEQRRLSDWSQDLGFPAAPNLPKELSACSDCPDSLAYNMATPNKFLMVSAHDNGLEHGLVGVYPFPMGCRFVTRSTLIFLYPSFIPVIHTFE